MSAPGLGVVVRSGDAVEALQREVGAGVRVFSPFVSLCGVRFHTIVVLSLPDDGGSEEMRAALERWCDDLQVRLVPNGRIVWP
jgi:hypothetical protein